MKQVLLRLGQFCLHLFAFYSVHVLYSVQLFHMDVYIYSTNALITVKKIVSKEFLPSLKFNFLTIDTGPYFLHVSMPSAII